MNPKFILFILFTVFLSKVYSQDSTDFRNLDNLLNQAEAQVKVALYEEALITFDKIIELSKKKNHLEYFVSSSISIAEIKRATTDFEEGYEILINLKKSTEFPKLHVRKLERMAAICQEGGTTFFPIEQNTALECLYLDSAISLAKKNHFKQELAGLYNLKGFYLFQRHIDSSLYFFKSSADLFLEVGDTQNYVLAKTNQIRVYKLKGNSVKAVETFRQINRFLKNKDWYGTKSNLYQLIAELFESKDTSLANYWKLEYYKNLVSNKTAVNSKRIIAYRTLYETQKYQKETRQKEIELEGESKSKNQLLLYFGIFGILSLGIVVLFFRERTLKKSVNKANDRYQMLLVESNHRIKNNLQMIISMLEYASKSLKNENSMAFKNMSGKIYTISALHKHLYLDVHNERVDLDTYFNEIVNLYLDLASPSISIKKSIISCQIQSERIVYFGLILNEMLSNTIEHGKSIKNLIDIKVEQLEDGFQFTYQDFSPFEAKTSDGTGMTLIKQLVNRVEGSHFYLDSKTGKYQFQFYG